MGGLIDKGRSFSGFLHVDRSDAWMDAGWLDDRQRASQPDSQPKRWVDYLQLRLVWFCLG